MPGRPLRIGLLWRAEWDPPGAGRPRLHGMFTAFEELGVTAVPIVYSDDRLAAVRGNLLELDGVLVWVNPVEQGLDRVRLDSLLREAAEAGTWVSAHPDVILRLATKEVLVDTAAMSWSAGTHLYRTHEQLAEELPKRLAAPIVLKQQRGMGGEGVWKVERTGEALRVQHAAGGATPVVEPLEAFLDRCRPYFANGGSMVEQPFQPRLAEGMIRVYLCRDEVVGFAHQYPRGLVDPELAATLPAEKVFERPSAYESLRRRMELHWVGELQAITGVDRSSLPVIWDADFLLGPKRDGDDTYVLCEINASSTFSFPEFAMPAVARAALQAVLAARAEARSSASASSARSHRSV